MKDTAEKLSAIRIEEMQNPEKETAELKKLQNKQACLFVLVLCCCSHLCLPLPLPFSLWSCCSVACSVADRVRPQAEEFSMTRIQMEDSLRKVPSPPPIPLFFSSSFFFLFPL
jgi:hypothetical protein